MRIFLKTVPVQRKITYPINLIDYDRVDLSSQKGKFAGDPDTILCKLR